MLRNFRKFLNMVEVCLKPALICLLCLMAGASIAADSEIEKGRRIYMEGVLASGAPLKGMRAGIEVSGAQAACVSCHRASGMGAVEGDVVAPPITGHYLYRTGDLMMATLDPRSGKRFNQAHDPYTDQTLGRAIRNGVNVGGQEMSVLMPRYGLAGEDLKSLIAYLKQLSSEHSPGVTSEVVQFATVITPDVSPERRAIVLRMLQRMFIQKNGSTVQGKNATGRRHMVTAAEMVLGTERKWELNVWELRGAPETWAVQLDNYYHAQPVFAMVSGLSGSTWKPVHEFCEKERMPCWFPSVDMPVETDNRYTLYFQRGVTLEAGVIANYLRDAPERLPARIVQYYWDDSLGRGASAALAGAMKDTGVVIENRPISPVKTGGLQAELAALTERDMVMLWLRPQDLSLFDEVAPPKAMVYLSGRLAAGSGKFPLPQAWAKGARMVYPYELPDKRALSLDYFHRWLRLNMIPLEDEPLQAEVYFALEYLTETMSEMLDNLYRDYMIERAENMLSRSQGGNAEHRDRVREALRWSHQVPRGVPGYRELVKPAQEKEATQQAASAGTEARGKSTTIYPRMSLGVSQRFASKGAYIVRFDLVDQSRLVPESAWIVP